MSNTSSGVESKLTGRASSRRTKRWIAVAAAVIVVAGGAVAISASKSGESQRSGTVISGPTGTAVATTVAAGGGSSCAVSATQLARCWGANSYGQVGNGTSSTNGTSGANISTASTVKLGSGYLQPVVAIAAGESHACAIVGTATNVYCWGSNSSG